MKNIIKNIYTKIEYFFVTAFFTGLLPKMPGTYASFLSMLLIYFIIKFTNFYFYFFVTIFITLYGTYAIKNYEKRNNIHDDPKTAIDEVIGMFVGIIPVYKLLSNNNNLLFLIFIYTVLFRFFDILKPGIIGKIDKNMHNEIGTVLDDIVAALFSTILLFIIILFKI